MTNKLFITNLVPDNIFAKSSTFKYSSSYFKENGWTTKYFTEKWDENLEDYDIVFLWSIHQFDDQRHLKSQCLLKLIDLQTINKYKYKILDYIEDIHHLKLFYSLEYDFYKQHFSIGSRNYIVGRYHVPLLKTFTDCNCYIIPYSIDQSYIPSFNQTPKKELLLIGCIYNEAYPIRYKIFKLRNTYPISVLDHPGYGILQHNCTDKSYFNKINEYIASVSTCAAKQYNYVLAKYFEIPATGALLFAYVEPVIKDLTDYGFIDMVNMVSFNDDNFVQKLQYVLDENNREDIDKIRLNGYNLVLERHTHDIRFNIEFDKFVNDLLV